MGAAARRQPLAKTRKSGLSHFFDSLGGERYMMYLSPLC